MFGWFRDRLKNSRPWFCINMGIEKVEGRKQSDGHLCLTLTTSSGTVSVIVDRENAVKLSEWLGRTYPYRINNVIPIRKPFSVLSTQTNSTGDTETPRREL